MLANGMKWISVSALFLAACTALAQTNPSRSPAAEAPWYVRSGKAKLVGHFNNPQQMLRLAFGLVHPHAAEEEEFLQELMTPGSPQFRHFLTMEEWNARFSPSAEDEQAVVDWAISQGMTITKRWPNRLLVDVEAPVATIEKALQVTINNYQLDGYTYFSNAGDAVIPAHLSGIILSVAGLDNLPRAHPASFHGKQPPGPVYTPGPVVGVGPTYQADAGGTRRQQGRADVANITYGPYAPSDIFSQAAYNYDGLKNLGHCCNPNIGANPSGSPPESSIALATYGYVQESDVSDFATQFGLAVNFTPVAIDGGTSWGATGADRETTLDTEWSTATSNSFDTPSDTAHVYVYEAPNAGDAADVFNAMLSDGHARIFSTSWSWTENYGISSSDMVTLHGIFNEMVGAGWVLMTASGDRGATDDCAHVAVSYPASDPDVVGVGGTTLDTDSTFTSEVAWTGGTTGGSCSSNNGGSGGGCSVHFLTPSFQSGSNASCGAYRSVPDIALNANTGQDIYFDGGWWSIGGTSISSPMLAGFFAQEGAYLLYLYGSSYTGMGNGNPYLYYFGLGTTPAPAHYPFYDITSGCNSNDVTIADGYTAFCAGPGYDSVTGWGSANMFQLAWAINTDIAGGSAAPDVNFTGPATGSSTWYNTSQKVKWSISAQPGDLNGVAGYSAAWDSLPPDSYSPTTPDTPWTGGTPVDSFYTGPLTPNSTSGSLYLDNGTGHSGEGCHTAHVRAWDDGGATSDNTYGPLCFDNVPPTVNCTKQTSPVYNNLWYATDVTYSCTAFDPPPDSGLENPSDASFGLSTNVPANTDTTSAYANPSPFTVYDNANNSTSVQYGPFDVDKKAPVASCSLAPSPSPVYKSWYKTNVIEQCSATDGTGSGLANPALGSFDLVTTVPANTETASAYTPSQAVADNVGNTTTLGPYGPFEVDMKPPTIVISQPAATTYTHSSTLTLSYTVNDYGSGVHSYTPTMNGSTKVGGGGLASGTAINLLTELPLGPNTFKISATDNVGNSDSPSVTFTIIVTPQSIINDVKQFQASHAISGLFAPFLLGYLESAVKPYNAGKCGVADDDYSNFISTVQILEGTGAISRTDASILIADAKYLTSHCP